MAGWGVFLDVLPYYARHLVIPVGKLDQLKKLFEQRTKDQALYIVAEQKSLEALESAFETSLVLTGRGQPDAEKRLILVKVMNMFD